MIYFSDNKKKIDKEALKVLGKYKKNKSIVLQKIDPEKSGLLNRKSSSDVNI